MANDKDEQSKGNEAKTDAKPAAEARTAKIKHQKKTAKKVTTSGSSDSDGDEKSEREKKIAAMKAKIRANSSGTDGVEKGGDKKSSRKSAAAIAKAKAVRAKRAQAEKEQKPSPNQPLLDQYVGVIRENIGKDVLEDAYINRLAKDVPTLVAKKETYYQVAEFLRQNEQLAFNYLSEIHGVDHETHMEVYVHLFSFKHRQPVALKVKIDREHPEIDSITPLWAGANWPEREVYDLLGIVFIDHPNLSRIMMPDHWVGHPLRKDYEPYDVEV